MIRPFLGVFAAALLSTSALAAPTAPPAPVADLVKMVDIPHESFTLPNGLRVIVSTDRKAPVVAVSIWYHVGSRYEPAGKTGFWSMLHEARTDLSMLLALMFLLSVGAGAWSLDARVSRGSAR